MSQTASTPVRCPYCESQNVSLSTLIRIEGRDAKGELQLEQPGSDANRVVCASCRREFPPADLR